MADELKTTPPTVTGDGVNADIELQSPDAPGLLTPDVIAAAKAKDEAEAAERGPGRPTVMTNLVLVKLEAAFGYGYTDEQACFFAGISVDALYNFQKDHPEYIERKKALKDRPVMLAKRTVIEAARKDPDMAFRLLERRARKEYGPKLDIGDSDDPVTEIKVTIKRTAPSKDESADTPSSVIAPSPEAETAQEAPTAQQGTTAETPPVPVPSTTAEPPQKKEVVVG